MTHVFDRVSICCVSSCFWKEHSLQFISAAKNILNWVILQLMEKSPAFLCGARCFWNNTKITIDITLKLHIDRIASKLSSSTSWTVLMLL